MMMPRKANPGKEAQRMKALEDKYVKLFAAVMVVLFVISLSTIFISIMGVMPDVTKRVSFLSLRAAQANCVLLIFALFRFHKANARRRAD